MGEVDTKFDGQLLQNLCSKFASRAIPGLSDPDDKARSGLPAKYNFYFRVNPWTKLWAYGLFCILLAPQSQRAQSRHWLRSRENRARYWFKVLKLGNIMYANGNLVIILAWGVSNRNSQQKRKRKGKFCWNSSLIPSLDNIVLSLRIELFYFCVLKCILRHLKRYIKRSTVLNLGCKYVC